MMRSIARYAQKRNWRIQVCGIQQRDIEELSRNFEIRGVIAHVTHPDLARQLRDLDVPVINISGHNPVAHQFPYVVPDFHQAGRLAADYFWQKGYRHFALEPFPQRFPEWYFTQCGEAFRARLKDYGAICHELEESFHYTREGGSEPMQVDYPRCPLRELPRPFALFVMSDRLAARIGGIAQDQNLGIPEDVALLGLGNFELVCETSYPPLSSIQTNNGEQGQKAAEWLDQYLRGNPFDQREQLIPVQGIVTRRSSDALAIVDRSLAKAIHFIRSADLSRVRCQEVAQASGINRRTLERKCKQHLGRTLYHEIQRWRSERARELLQTTFLPIKHVALEAGFRNADHMGKVLKANLGQTPRQLRQKNQKP